ncbi:MAG: 2,3,4,5-tetrahydropyridine-2,6-dicarboxylate N-succinyltransferase, partial [Rhizobiales bacterium]|nr:2,3,4,5-tetrahydropyridine-2,6-dicarboxylate N-succinyltransferase [Hyphomicrobiales bacterium]
MSLENIINNAFEDRANLSIATTGEIREAVEEALNLLDNGEARVAEKKGDEWVVNQWLKKAVLLSFVLNDMKIMECGPDNAHWWDKVESKFLGWGENRFREAGFRAVPGSIVRKSAYIAKGAILMPSFVNLGAYVDEGTMVDTWVTVGSCAQIGKNVHVSAAVQIGGVLEPVGASPVIIEDDAFLSAGVVIVEGIVVRKGAVLAPGVSLSA